MTIFLTANHFACEVILTIRWGLGRALLDPVPTRGSGG